MHASYIGSLLAAGSIAAMVSAAPAQAQLADEVQISLPAQDLAVSLREVSTRTGRNIIVPAELVRGRQAPAVSGPFTAEGAVRVLLTGSGLGVRRVGDSLVVYLPEATIPNAEADEGAASAGDGDETIIVTGTNIRGSQPTSPLIVIGRTEIDQSGATSVEQLMRDVPQNSQAGVSQENFRVPGAGADPTEQGAGLNLRGLGQRATLVLVNGRRVAPSGAGSFVDVSLIPISAVERVEILPDGASAIYGSDAVGGVINFIMRRNFNGLETTVRAGTATQGDGDEFLASAIGGRSWSTGNAMLAYEYRLQDEVLARDRPYTINLSPGTVLLPRERRHSLFGTARQEIADGLELDVAASYSHRDTDRSYFLLGNPLPVNAVAEARALTGTGTLSYRFESDWLARVNAGYSRSSSTQSQTQPGGQELVNRVDTRHEIYDLGFQADGSILSLPGGNVRAAFGAQGRRESSVDIFETRVNPARTLSADREVRSLFAELYVPLFSQANRFGGMERLTVTAALRYEHYDRYGGSYDPRLGVLWSPLRGLSLRASYGTSFRAPLLSESVGLYNAFYFAAGVLTIAPPSPGGVALGLGGSNPDIRPERSESWTAGMDFLPAFAPGLEARANYYSIRFSDRIALPSPSLAIIGNPAFEPILSRNPSTQDVLNILAGARQVLDFSGPGFTNGGATPGNVTVIIDNRFGNTAVTSTTGIDLGLRYGFDFGRNHFSADVNANYILSFDDRLTSAAPPISALNRPYRPVDLRVRGSLAWTRGGWSGVLSANYTDSYRDDRRPVVLSIPSSTIVDAQLGYSFGGNTGNRRSLRIALDVQNLFDTDPPALQPDNGATSGVGYDPVNASARGRIVSLSLRRVW
jgi:outer membrane receptor protein involved in Fe transport